MATESMKITAAAVKQVSDAAINTAVMLGKIADLSTTVEQVIEIAEDNRKSPIAIHRVLRDEVAEDMRAAWPALGSKAGDSNTPVFDLYEYIDGNGTRKAGSYWREVAKEYPIGKDIQAQLALLADGPDKGKDTSGVNVAKKKQLQARFTSFNTNFRQGVHLFTAMAAANELAGVKATYAQVVERDDKGVPVKDAKGKLSMIEDFDTICPIKVEDKTDPAKARYFTVPNFLRLNTIETMAKGGLFEDFISSAKRQPTTPETVGIKIENISQFEDATIAMNGILERLKNTGPKAISDLLKFYNAAGSDDRVATLFSLAENLSILTMNEGLKKRADALMIEGHEPGQKKAA